jgi:hypothetical protein
VPWIESSFGVQFDPTLYYITQIPSEVHGVQVFWWR